MDPATGALSVAAASDLFVDPVGLAWSAVTDLMALADPDADASRFGADSRGFAGHGAVFAVDGVSGSVGVLSDGSDYPAGIPGGRPSIFEDPVAVAFSRDGRLFVADQLAMPAFTGNLGAVFEIDTMTGTVALAATSDLFRGLRDLAVEPAGTLLVLDRLAAGRGTLFRVDVSGGPPGVVLATLSAPDFVEPSGVAVAGNGRIFLVDPSASPLGGDSFGAVFEIDTALTTATPVAVSSDWVSPWSLDFLEQSSLDGAAPGSAAAGAALTVGLVGGPFTPAATVDFGAGITVIDVRFVSPTALDVDVVVAAGAAAGARDVAVTNADGTHAFHCDLFDVIPPGSCAVGAPLPTTLLVSKDAGDVLLEWGAVTDPCLAEYRVRRAFRARPSVGAGNWPADPPFADVTGLDADATAVDTDFRAPATLGENELYLVVGLGTDGVEGPSGHY